MKYKWLGNKEKKPWYISKTIDIKRLRLIFKWNSRYNWMGRFGGGWDWKVGFGLGGSSLLINLLFCFISISIREKRGV